MPHEQKVLLLHAVGKTLHIKAGVRLQFPTGGLSIRR
jgi:hypothetical protein